MKKMRLFDIGSNLSKKIIPLFLLGLPGILLASQNPGNFSLTNNGLVFSAKNGEYQGSAGGRVAYEANAFQNTQQGFHNGGYLKELYSFVSATFFKDWVFFQDAGWLWPNKLENLNLSYVGSTWFSQTVGQFSPSFGLSNDDTTPFIPMITLPLAAYAFAPWYNVGGQLQINNQFLSFFLAATGPQIAQKQVNHPPSAYLSRFVLSPVHTETKTMHWGLSLWQRYPDGSHTLSFSALPDASINLLINTDNIQDVQSSFTGDLEGLFTWHSYDVQAEYFLNHTICNASQPNLTFRGYYVEAGYFLTGDSFHYNYPGGYIDSVNKPKHAYGAWLVNAQFSTLNLNSRNILGGLEKDATLGLSWYFNENFIAKFNATRVWARLPTTEEHYTNNIYALYLIALFQ